VLYLYHYSLHNNATSSRKLLKMDVLTSETCWAVNSHNKASVIKLVYLHSNIKMMHGPIRIRYYPGVCSEELRKKAQVTIDNEAGVPTNRTRRLLQRSNCRDFFTETQYSKWQTLHPTEHWQSSFVHCTRNPVQWVPRGSFPGGQVRWSVRLSPTAAFSRGFDWRKLYSHASGSILRFSSR